MLCRSPHGERGLKFSTKGGGGEEKNVALLTESVDWNSFVSKCDDERTMSLSSRRAWIEMWYGNGWTLRCQGSLSSRRAWIEIYCSAYCSWHTWVALLTESVDWNTTLRLTLILLCSRSPHGERGLKSVPAIYGTIEHAVALLTESVDWNILFNPPPTSCDCRSPHGERGLKFLQKNLRSLKLAGRSPHGERGLKSHQHISI